MKIRNWHRLWIPVDLAWHERANYEVWPFKGLVSCWRHMKAASVRLVIMDVEGPRVQVAIPANHIERVMINDPAIQHIIKLELHFVTACLVDGL